jgi:branched-chain amino acid transport system substrate-binding protein
MKHRKLLITIAVICMALIVVSLPFLSACGEDKGGKTLKIGISTPSSGPAAEKGSPMGHGNLDCMKYVNEELDGVDGYQIEVVWLDNGYDASKMVTNAKKFMDDGCLLFSTSSSAMMTAAMETANRAEFPGLVCFNSPILHRPPQHIYGQKADYADDWLVFAEYYMENIWKGSGKPKMALHVLNNSTGAGAKDGAKAGADKYGIEIVAIEEHATTTISEMESLTRIKALQPDVIFIGSTPKPAAVIMKNIVELGMYPGITIACGQAAFTKSLIDIAGADTVEGVYGVYPAAGWGDDVPGMEKLLEYCEELHPNDMGNSDYLTSWAQSLIMVEILRKALEEVDYEVLAKGDIESWRAIEKYGFQSLDGYDVEGLQAPVSYTAGDNRLSNLTKIYQIQNGNIVTLTDWIEAELIKFEELDWFGK